MTDVSESAANRPFNEMGLDSLMGVEIKQLIESQLDISLTMQEVLELKINDLKELEKNSSGNPNAKDKDSSNVSLKFNFVFPSKFFNTESVVSFNANAKGVPIVVVTVDNSDGTHFKLLAESMGVPVYVLVRTKLTPLTDMKALTAWYLNLIKSRSLENFHLIGCSYGGCIALHISQKDETNCLRSLTLLDGSEPIIKALSKETNIGEVEVSSICDFLKQFTSDCLNELKEELLKVKSLKEKIKIVMDILNNSSQNVNKLEFSNALESHLQVSKLIQSYVQSQPLSINILLIEDPQKVLPNDISEIKTTMSQVCSGKITIQRLLSRQDLCNQDSLKLLLNTFKGVLY